MSIKLPTYDKDGNNIFDPRDRRGIKEKYITILHEKVLLRYLPKGFNKKIAIDLGCGYGRITPIIARKKWRVIGIDPDPQLIKIARHNNPRIKFIVGGLPNLPLVNNSVDLMVMHNLIRPLHILSRLHCIEGVGKYFKNDGILFVVDNIRDNHPDYVSEGAIIKMFVKEGFKLEKRMPIRRGRWILLYLIRYGLVPIFLLDKVAQYEMRKMKNIKSRPRFCYYNVLFIFRKKNAFHE